MKNLIRMASVCASVFMIAASFTSCTLFRSANESDETSFDTKSGDNYITTDIPQSEETPNSVVPVIPTPIPGAPKSVCIDAGHGYNDPGCTSDYLKGKYEREITAEYANELKASLEAAGYRVVMLREGDKCPSVKEIEKAADAVGMEYMPDKLVDDGRFAAYNRTVWANTLHRESYIDLFISLHVDSYDASEDVRGTRVYYCSENDYSSDSAKVCADVTGQMKKYLPDQNTKYYAKNWEDAFVVTKRSDMPSFLMEMGFATNKTDAENMLDSEWRDKLIRAITDGVREYFGE